MRWLAVALLIVVLLLQYRLWLSPDGVRELARLEEAVTTQRKTNETLVERNQQLAAEVRDLKTGTTALEERARSDLGMIAGNETFYQVVPRQSRGQGVAPNIPAAATTSTRTAAAPPR
jgi:cell division protein FtsB